MGVFTSQTTDEMSFDLNPTTDLNLSLKISAHTIGRGNEKEGQTRGNEVLDLRATESLTRLENAALAGTWERLDSCSSSIFAKPCVRFFLVLSLSIGINGAEVHRDLFGLQHGEKVHLEVCGPFIFTVTREPGLLNKISQNKTPSREIKTNQLPVPVRCSY